MRAPVLVIGEPGSGRDTVVEVLHAQSRYADRPLERVRCGSGGNREGRGNGGDSGSGRNPIRRRVPARGSVVYLDRVERLCADEQKIWLEHLGLEGGPGARRVARVYASADLPFTQFCEASGVETPLARYLSEAVLFLPALRERRDDIPELIDHLAGRVGARLGRPPGTIEPAAYARLIEQPWPGNLTELEAVIEKALAFAPAGDIRAEDVDLISTEHRLVGRAAEGEDAAGRHAELFALLEANGGNLAAAARSLGLSRSALTGRARRLGLLAARVAPQSSPRP
jgi:two-component system NtrC family response regulator